MQLKLIRVLALAGALFLAGSRSSFAVPVLQLDIQGGHYDNNMKEIVSTSTVFTLYAYLTPKPGTSQAELQQMLNTQYFIAAAVVPKMMPPGCDNCGTFSFNPLDGNFTSIVPEPTSTTVHVSADMLYGDPPIETRLKGCADPDSAAQYDYCAQFDAGDLAQHSVYNTYFKQFGFKFDSTDRAASYDTADHPGGMSAPNPNGGTYFARFDVDVRDLKPTFQINFDLYSEEFETKQDIDIDLFAPFSHSARSMVVAASPVPEPSSMLLLGGGLVTMAARWRRRKGAAS